MPRVSLTSVSPSESTSFLTEWRRIAMRRALQGGLGMMAVLVPTVCLLERSAVGLWMVPAVILYAAPLAWVERDWRRARVMLMVTTHLMSVFFTVMFGHRALTHALSLAVIPLVYVVYDGEGRARNRALVTALGIFVGIDLAGRTGLLPTVLPGDTARYVPISLVATFFVILRRTHLMADFSLAMRKHLSEQHRRLDEAQATAHIGSFDHDLSTNRAVWSREMQNICALAQPEGAAPFAPLLARVHPDDRDRVAHEMAQLRADPGVERAAEFRIVRPDGDVRTLRASAGLLVDDEGRPERVVGTLQDVTEGRRKEAALVRAREAAEDASRAKSAFLANMSHELRTPMNGVLGMTALALETELTDEQRSYVDAAHTSGLALLTILNDILDLSKIEAGKLTVELVSFSLRTVVEQAMQLLAPRAQQKGIALTAAVDDAVPPRHLGDPVRVRQLLVNLIGNAVKFTERGGVHVAVSLDAAERVEMRVIDTGVGIPEDRRQAIFEAFTQADGSTARRFGGTGLGLTICRELVRLMGGTLDVTSAVGEGSTFCAVLPMPRTHRAGTDHGKVRVRPVTGPERPTPPRPLRVLLAEDNAVNATIARLLVERAGHAVTHVLDGAGAVEAVAREPFDLVLMDVQMPVVDGLEATRRIRAAGSRVLIVSMTANAMKGDEEACLAAGMDAYLSKPLSFSKLHDVLVRAAQAPSG
jgi:signal transduction histidine kinase